MKPFIIDNDKKIPSGFTTPPGYFDNFTEKMMQQLPVQEVKVIPLYKKASAWMSAIAALFIIALSCTLYFKAENNVQPNDTAIENYLVYQANVNTYDLMQNLDDSDIAELEQSITLDNDAIEMYLEDQNGYNNY